MALTDKGKLLLEKAQATLDSAVDLVNIAATNQNCPGISLEVNQQSSGKIIETIKNNTLDGGYIFADENSSLNEAFRLSLIHI